MTGYKYLVLLLFFTQALTAQNNGLVAYYSFDNCDATDDSGNGADGVISGNPDCECGVFNNALVLDGGSDFIQFLGDFDILFADDFTISLYFRLTSTTQNTYDFLSKKSGCTLDSSLSVRIINNGARVFTELTESASLSEFVNTDLDPNKCWHHLAIVRVLDETRIYYNGVSVSTDFAGAQLDIGNNGIFSIANSPCLANGEARFAGGIDELRLYNRALSTNEIKDLYKPLDEIPITSTIIFKGDSYTTSILATCADQITWSPDFNVSDINALNPDLTPDVTTRYRANFSYPGCIATDTILLTVVDSAEFTCENIFLPNAFTPNGDNLNEVFGISNVVFLGDLISFDIFDRFGGKVFAAQNPMEKWDGTFNGDPALPGMYIYKIRFTCDGEEKFKNGSLTLIR